MSGAAGAAVFSAESLDANRNGQLSDWQRRALRNGLGWRHSGLTGLVGRAVDPVARDVEAGFVQYMDGAMRKLPPQQQYGNLPARHFLEVGNRTAGVVRFRCSREIYNFAPDAAMVRLYYLPRSAHVVNLELLPVAPVGADGPAQAVRYWQGATMAHDEVGRLEAAAQMAAMEATVTAAPGPAAGGPPGAPAGAPAAGPGELAGALIGTWLSPFLNVSFRADGTLAAHLPDGSDHQGQWSLGPGGRLHATVMGSPMEAGASVSGGILTLVLDGQALTLHRGADR